MSHSKNESRGRMVQLISSTTVHLTRGHFKIKLVTSRENLFAAIYDQALIDDTESGIRAKVRGDDIYLRVEIGPNICDSWVVNITRGFFHKFYLYPGCSVILYTEFPKKVPIYPSEGRLDYIFVRHGLYVVKCRRI